MKRPTKTSKPAPAKAPALSLDDRMIGALIRKHFQEEVEEVALKNVFKKSTAETCSEATMGFFRSLDSIEFDGSSAELVFLAFQELLAERLPIWMHDELVRIGTPRKPRVVAPAGEVLLNIAEVQAKTGMGKNFCYKLCKHGKLEVRMLTARTLRVTAESVDAWIESRNPVKKKPLSKIVAKPVARAPRR